jgi:Flp pilus assembly protein TadB
MTEKQGLEGQLKRVGRFLLISSIIGTVLLLIVVLVREELTVEALFFVGIWLIWAVFMLTRSDMLRRR